jgi:hypothetical protein
MHNPIVRLLIASVIVLACSARAEAHDTYVVQQGPAPLAQPYAPGYGYAYVPERPRDSIFRFGYRGMLAGALAGLGASYFVARESDDPWRDVGVTTGIGALSGAALGVTLGVFDRVGMDSAYYISRDMSYGVGFGALVGAIGGGVMALGDGDGEYVLYGAAGGSLVGLALGVLTGTIEGQVRDERAQRSSARRVSVSIARVGAQADGWGARLGGRF